MTQYWFCNTCQQAGAVEIPEHASVQEGVGAITHDHRQRSPDCPRKSDPIIDALVFGTREEEVGGQKQVTQPKWPESSSDIRTADTLDDMPEWARILLANPA